MKNRFIWFGIFAAFIVGISTFFVGCENDVNAIVLYRGKVVYINTTTPFADLTVKVTDGKNTHCQAQTDTEGLFSLRVRVDEIDGNYYLLAGDSTCVPKKVSLGGFGQAEVDLGVIEVEGPALPTVVTTPLQSVKADEAILGGEVQTDGRMSVTARGVCYGTDPYPTIEGSHTTDGSGVGTFTSTLKNLTFNTIYYARAYATNKKGTAYGDQIKFTTEEGVALVVTDTIINITAHSAKCKGHVESDGGFPVTKRGTCWSKRPDPTVDDDCTDEGTGVGEFTSTLKDLVENTTYYIRTYATNSTSTVYGEQLIITTLDGLAVVTTDSINAVTASGFTAFGTTVSDCDIPIIGRGFCYATSQYPTVEDAYKIVGKGLGHFKNKFTNLQVGTTYYVRAFATNETGTVYGDQIEVTTLSGLPTVTTNEVTNIGSVKATCGGNVTDDGTLSVTARGVCYDTKPQPTIESPHTTDGKGKGNFTSNLTNLQDKTTYYVRAYATTSAGTAYGEQRTFKTENGTPVVQLKEVGVPTANSVTCKGNVTGDGGVTVTERGFCYALTQYPTNTDAHVAIGNGTGEFAGSLTGLNVNTTYYIRAYAVNSLGVGYSEQKTITTKNGLATITTTDPTSTATAISAGGNITDNGGYAVTERGVCYSASNSEPTITGEKVDGGKGNGTFSVSITGLSASATYYIRAYAVNENGVSYGETKSIQTKSGNAVSSIGAVSNITSTTASATVTVTETGDATLQSCGICWSANSNPTTADSKTEAGGKQLNTPYTCNMSGLQPNTKYYVRAYATTDAATAYSEQVSFTTSDGSATLELGEITNITALTASAIVTVSNTNGAALQSCGICWSANSNPTTADSKTEAGGKQLNTPYTCNLSNLVPNTVYYVRAYATTSITTVYSDQKSFCTHDGLPKLTTGTTSATSTNITVGGYILSDGGYNITSRGVCYSTSNSVPTIADNYTTSGIGTGTFSTIITNVSVSTTYYIRAYATNSIGTGYGAVVAVTTGNGLPSVTTTVIGENVTQNTAISGGQVTDDGGYAVTARGVCWNTLPYPTINNNKTTDGSGTGYYSSTITGIDLTSNNVYYVRAYATNKNGTTYGEQVLVSKENWDYKNLPAIEYGGYIYRLYPDMGAMTLSNAETACENLVYGGYDDWMLPETKDLLVHIMTNCKIGWKTASGETWTTGGTTYTAWYWTSQKTNSGSYVYYCVDIQGPNVKFDSYAGGSSLRVRPIRKYLANQ